MKTESNHPIVRQAVRESSGTPSLEAGAWRARSAGRWRWIAAGTWLALGLSTGLAQPVINGLFYMDGDNHQYPAIPSAQSAAGSKLYVRLVDGRLYVALVVAREVNDNVFDASANSAYLTSAGWGPGNNKTARRRMDSEFATFTLTVAGTSWTWLQGYCGQPGYKAGQGDRSQPNWISGVTVSGGQGTPPPSYVAASSLAWNLNRYAAGPNPWTMPGTDTDTASWKAPWLNAGEGAPGENPNTVIDPTEGYPATGQITYSPTYNWEWSMIYEWSVDFTNPGFGNVGSSPIYVVTGAAHHSPGKNGEEDDPLTPTDPSPLRDFGDLPGPYLTLLADNGPRHIIDIAGARLGASLDNELNGLPQIKALGDDLDGADDEEGVQLLTPLVPGQTAVVRVTVGGASGHLSAFIDWDGNGTLDTVTLVSATGPTTLAPGVIGDKAVSVGSYDLTISVPANATGAMPSRWRITNAAGQGGNSPTGEASSGEVEDHIFYASVGDRVWVDTDKNGVQDSGEAGLDNVTVRLYRPGYGPDGIPGNSDDADSAGTTTTAGGGLYSFTGLIPGEYYVEVVKPTGYTFSPQDQGADDTVDSDADTTTGMMATTPLVSGQNDTTWDAGLYSATPTAALLAHFSALRSDESVVTLQWGTLIESRVLGFRLNRAGADGQWVTVTPSIIAAHAGLTQSGAYRITDSTAAGAVRYQLVAVNLRGADQVLAETDVRNAPSLRSGLTDGMLRIEFHGTPNGQAVLETSTDPVRGPWETLETVALDPQGVAGLTHALDAGQPARFFRLRE